MSLRRTLSVAWISFLISTAAYANIGPIVDTFTATPEVPAPGQTVTITVTAHDPDCATSCSSGCGLYIAGNLLAWSDNSGRGTTAFQNSQPGVSGSPWSATVTWIAPPTEGTYTITASISDSGGMLCGGRKTTLATLPLTVTTAQPPVIDSMTVTPQSVPVGGTVQMTVAAHDPSSRALTYAFTADGGSITGDSPSSPTAVWMAPQTAGRFTLRVRVTAEGGASVSAQTMVNVEIGNFVRQLALTATRATRLAGLADGRFAVVDGAAGTLQVATPGGQVDWTSSGLATPAAVAIGNGEIFVLERGASRVSVWNSGGTRVRDFAVDAGLPNAIAAGPNPGELSITDTTSARVLVVSTSDGRPLRIIGVGLLSGPTGIASSYGRLAVADAVAGKILLFDANGVAIGAVGDDTLLVRPQGVAWDGGSKRLVVSDGFSGEIVIIGEEGGIRGSLAGFGSGPGQLVSPIDVALLAGNLVAATTVTGPISFFQLLSTLPPLAPATNVTAGDRAGDEGGVVAVSWSASLDDPPRVAAYVIQRSTGDSLELQPVGRVAARTTSFIDATTVDATCYHYTIVATDGATDRSSDPTPCAISRNDLPPPAPAAVTAAAESPFAIRVTWSAVAAADLAGYSVEISSPSSAPRIIKNSRDTTALLIQDLTPSTSYTVVVRAFDTAGNDSAGPSAGAATYADVPPETPSAVSAVDAKSGGSVNIWWTQPVGAVPVASYSVTLTPSVAGWPTVTLSSAVDHVRVNGLVNQLRYAVTVVASTPWMRTCAASAPVDVTPTAPARPLPIVGQAGWDGNRGMEEAAGITVTFPLDADRRELRLQYRTSGGATVQLLLDGTPLGVSPGTTAGSWSDAFVPIERQLLKDTPAHTLEFRNASFPDPAAQLAFRRIDFVPLPPLGLDTLEANTVIDLAWTWQAPRADLVVNVFHALDQRGTNVLQYVAIACNGAQIGRCRDTFLNNGDKYNYRFSIASPAGWTTDVIEVSRHAKYADTPPPVTDLRLEIAADGVHLDWTPLSTALTRSASPTPVARYRIYRKDAIGLTLLTEIAAPPALLPTGSFDPRSESIVVRSIDANGRESQ